MTGPSGPRCPRCQAPNPSGQAFCGSCGLALGAAPAPSPSRRSPAGPVFDLLRARNIYAVVTVTVVVFLVVTAAGWWSHSSGSPAAAPTGPAATSTPAPTATPAPSPTPPAVATPAPPSALLAATPAPSATPALTPTVPQLAAVVSGGRHRGQPGERRRDCHLADVGPDPHGREAPGEGVWGSRADVHPRRAEDRVVRRFQEPRAQGAHARQPAIRLLPLSDGVQDVGRLQHLLGPGRHGQQAGVRGGERASYRARPGARSPSGSLSQREPLGPRSRGESAPWSRPNRAPGCLLPTGRWATGGGARTHLVLPAALEGNAPGRHRRRAKPPATDPIPAGDGRWGFAPGSPIR